MPIRRCRPHKTLDCALCRDALNERQNRNYALRAKHGSRARVSSGCDCDICRQGELAYHIEQQKHEEDWGDNKSLFKKRIGRSEEHPDGMYTVSIDSEITAGDGDTFSGMMVGAGVQRHMIEWFDPTGDEVMYNVWEEDPFTLTNVP